MHPRARVLLVVIKEQNIKGVSGASQRLFYSPPKAQDEERREGALVDNQQFYEWYPEIV